MKRNSQAVWSSESFVFPILIGTFFYWYFTRLNGLDPRNVSWLLPFWHTHIDAAANYLGWEYFRSSPILQWPLGRTPSLGPGSGASISMTDSIPLMAFIFKPFTHWYHGTFQYFGIWTLTCFVLQAVASWKLLGIWVKGQFARGLGCCFFVIAPFAALLDGFVLLGLDCSIAKADRYDFQIALVSWFADDWRDVFFFSVRSTI